MKYEAGPSDNSFLLRVRELERVMSNDQLAFPRRFSCMYKGRYTRHKKASLRLFSLLNNRAARVDF